MPRGLPGVPDNPLRSGREAQSASSTLAYRAGRPAGPTWRVQWRPSKMRPRVRDRHPTTGSLPQQPEREVARTEMIESRFQIRQVAGHQIQLELVQSSGTRRRPEVDFAARIGFFLCNSCREIEDAGKFFQCGNTLGVDFDAFLRNR